MGRLGRNMALIGTVCILFVGCGSGVNGSPDTMEDTGASDDGDALDLDAAEEFSPPDEVECVVDGDCEDSDPCTTDICDEDSGTCTYEPVDLDGDGYASMEVDGAVCVGGTDCADDDGAVYPGASPDCSGVLDMDCDGAYDPDEDGDGYETGACGGEDCDDADPYAFPGSLELDCELDRDCNGRTDRDNDGDGYDSMLCGGADCDDTRAYLSPGEGEINCNGMDDDCNGEMALMEDADQDGYANGGCVAPGAETDCDDGDETVHPGAPTSCDVVDDDCSGSWQDESGSDDDADGYLDDACGGDDCDDTDADVHPRAPEICPDGIDHNCDGSVACREWEVCTPSGACEVPFETIAPGTFVMGSPEDEHGRWSNEVQHDVTLTRFFEIMAYQVTQDQFEALMGYDPSYFKPCGGNCPLENVTWHEAAAFANAMSTFLELDTCFSCTGSAGGVTCEPSATYATPYDCPGYRLPTEAEWEYAARAGTTGGTYNGTSTTDSCSNPNPVLEPIAWFCGNSEVSYGGCADLSGSGGPNCAGTQPVGLKASNPWGLYDMLGNVLDWCHDWYGEYSGAEIDPWGPVSGMYRVKRGGAWCWISGSARSANRTSGDPEWAAEIWGIRLARTLP